MAFAHLTHSREHAGFDAAIEHAKELAAATACEAVVMIDDGREACEQCPPVYLVQMAGLGDARGDVLATVTPSGEVL